MLEQDKNQPSASNLPSLTQSASLVLNRSQTILGLLRDVMQESSAEYWYELGNNASSAEDWDGAIYYYGKCIKSEPGRLIGGALDGIILACESRGEYRASEGDWVGSAEDKEMAVGAESYLDHLIAAAEAYWGYD